MSDLETVARTLELRVRAPSEEVARAARETVDALDRYRRAEAQIVEDLDDGFLVELRPTSIVGSALENTVFSVRCPEDGSGTSLLVAVEHFSSYQEKLLGIVPFGPKWVPGAGLYARALEALTETADRLGVDAEVSTQEEGLRSRLVPSELGTPVASKGTSGPEPPLEGSDLRFSERTPAQRAEVDPTIEYVARAEARAVCEYVSIGLDERGHPTLPAGEEFVSRWLAAATVVYDFGDDTTPACYGGCFLGVTTERLVGCWYNGFQFLEEGAGKLDEGDRAWIAFSWTFDTLAQIFLEGKPRRLRGIDITRVRLVGGTTTLAQVDIDAVMPADANWAGPPTNSTPDLQGWYRALAISLAQANARHRLSGMSGDSPIRAHLESLATGSDDRWTSAASPFKDGEAAVVAEMDLNGSDHDAHASPTPPVAGGAPPHRAGTTKMFAISGLVLIAAALAFVLGSLVMRGGSDTDAKGPMVTIALTPTSSVGDDDLEQAADVLTTRAERVGWAGAEASVSGARILFSVPATRDSGDVSRLTRPGNFSVYDWEANVIGPDGEPAPTDPEVTGGPSAGLVGGISYYDAVARASQQPAAEGEAAEQVSHDGLYYLLDQKKERVVGGPQEEKADLFSERPDSADAADCEDGAEEKLCVAVVQPGTTILLETPDGQAERKDPNNEEYYVLRDRVALSSTDIKNPEQQFDQDAGGSGQPIVTFDFTDEGRETWQAVTRQISQRGLENFAPGTNPQVAAQHFAFVLDNELISVPFIDFEQNPDGIDGSDGSQVEGGFTIESAQELEAFLASGPLRVGLQVVA